MMPKHFCVVDDDDDFLHFLNEYIVARGLKATTFRSAEALLARGEFQDFDFFVLDLGLPGIDGVDLTSMIRAKSAAGILVVSGRMGPDAFNSALSAGADMFINKPVRFDQIYNAIQTVYRRSKSATSNNDRWRFEPVSLTLLDPQGCAISVSSIEAALLQCLIENAPLPVSRETLAAHAEIQPGPDFRNLDAAIFRLRRKIERETGNPPPLRTERGKGYALSAPIEKT